MNSKTFQGKSLPMQCTETDRVRDAQVTNSATSTEGQWHGQECGGEQVGALSAWLAQLQLRVKVRLLAARPET